MGKIKSRVAIGLLMGAWVAISGAQEIAVTEVTKEQFRALDRQVLVLKNEVLDISDKLTQFREKSVYPADARLSVFIALAEDDQVSIAAVSIKIDGKEAAHKTYSPAELDALRHGGAHRIFTGNIPAGEHALDVVLIGKSGSQNDSQNAEYRFTKEAGEKVIAITLAEPGFGKRISFRD